jgi:plasmid stability protein
MATLTIRNLPDDVHDKLRVRAAQHRRSVEAEARALLAAGVGTAPEVKGTPLSSLGSMRGEIKVLGDWKEMDREIEEMFEESINRPLDPT